MRLLVSLSALGFCFFLGVFKKILPYIYFMYECLPVCTHVQRPAEGVRTSPHPLEPGVTDGLVSCCGCWEQNLGPLERQPVLSTAKPLLQPLVFLFLFLFFKNGLCPRFPHLKAYCIALMTNPHGRPRLWRTHSKAPCGSLGLPKGSSLLLYLNTHL